MSEVINGVEVFISIRGAFVDAVVRAETEADWVQGAVFYGLMTPNDDGTMATSPGVNLSVIGPVVLTPGDPENDVPPVMDDRYHINMRLSGQALAAQDEGENLKWRAMAVAWSTLGAPDPKTNAQEEARVLHNVALISPASIATPMRIWG